MLGTALVNALLLRAATFVATSRQPVAPRAGVQIHQLDLLDSSATTRWLGAVRPDVLIHCAALTDVDLCERDPELAQRVHLDATVCLAEALHRSGGRLIYISTDSVFDGRRAAPYRETDATGPVNVYARTKLAGERVSLQTDQALVLRTNIFGRGARGRKTSAEWMLDQLRSRRDFPAFNDVVFSPVHVSEMANVVLDALDVGLTGLFHAAGSDTLSKYTFAKLLADAFQLESDCVRSASVESVALHANRPRNMGLDVSAISAALGRPMPSLAASLGRFVAAA